MDTSNTSSDLPDFFYRNTGLVVHKGRPHFFRVSKGEGHLFKHKELRRALRVLRNGPEEYPKGYYEEAVRIGASFVHNSPDIISSCSSAWHGGVIHTDGRDVHLYHAKDSAAFLRWVYATAALEFATTPRTEQIIAKEKTRKIPAQHKHERAFLREVRTYKAALHQTFGNDILDEMHVLCLESFGGFRCPPPLAGYSRFAQRLSSMLAQVAQN